MNKTVTVNIGGFSFVINEVAHNLLQGYLTKIELKLSVDSAEIMQDIESRIAELLKERLDGTKEVVDESDIEYIQSVMGTPEDFEDEENTNEAYDSYEEMYTEPEKALYRDMDNAMLGGVCSGLAKYFNIDPLVMRIIFVFFGVFLGSGILIYIILLIVIPEAKTTAQKLRMNGEAINLESIKSHFNKVGNDLNSKIKSKHFSRKVNSATNKTIEAVSNVAKIFGTIVGVAFTIAGIVSIVFLILYITGSSEIVPFTSFIVADNLYDFLTVVFPSRLFVNMALLSLIFVIGLPLISIVYVGLKLVFDLKTKIPTSIKVASGIVFGVAFSFLCISLVRTGMDFSSDGLSRSYIETSEVGNQLEIKVMNNDAIFSENESEYGCCQYMSISDNQIALKEVNLYLKEGTDSSQFIIKTVALSQGMTDSKASALAQAVGESYSIELNDSTLTIPSYFLVNKQDKFRAQRVKVVVEVPPGKSVKFGENIHHINCIIDDGDYNYHRYYNKRKLNNAVWKSINGEIQCETCWD